MRRYLFGPIPAAYADQNLAAARQRKDCLTFGHGEGDIVLRPGDTFESLVSRLPPGWRPDFLALYLPYSSIPEALWSAPVPIVGVASDWNLMWHLYRHRLPRCDIVLTDTPGVEAMTREGFTHVRPANLFGCERGLLERNRPEAPRDIDILFVGNFNSAVQRERMPYFMRLARFASRCNVVIRTAVGRAEYHDLLSRSRVVFNRGVRGECNLRVFEAAASGALLLQEAGNREVGSYFEDRRECLFYTDADLESLLEEILPDEERRLELADAALRRVEGYGFDALWQQALGRLDGEWPAIEQRARSRFQPDATSVLLGRVWQAACSAPRLDPTLEHHLGQALTRQPDSAALHHAMGTLLALIHLREQPNNVTLLARAADYFRDAAGGALKHHVALLNHAELLAGLGRRGEAADEAAELLDLLDRSTAMDSSRPEGAHVPPAWDHFRVEWEATAWRHAGAPVLEGEAKLKLLRWRAEALRAELTGSLAAFEAAVAARPDLAPTRAALGCALGRAGRPGDALPHLRAAVAANPLDLAAARALAEALANTGDAEGVRNLARDRDLLRRAVPQVVAPEKWFAGAVRTRPALVSACLTVRDEEANLPACLAGIAGLMHEVIVVDTGSTDRTPEVAASLGGRVIDFAWADDFAAARNEALRHATGDWIFWLDADERLDGRNRTRLRVLLIGLGDEKAAFVLTCANDSPGGEEPGVLEQVRLFRNMPGLAWEGRAHEQIVPSLRRAGAELRRVNITLHKASLIRTGEKP